MSNIISSSKVWKFPENMDTELMLPGAYLWHSAEERAAVLFQANRPGWVSQVKRGDALVAGPNFGIGSSRPAGLSLRMIGISVVLADSINGLFFRTAVNFGLPIFEVPGVAAAFEEGDGVEVNIDQWIVRNRRTGATLAVKPVPEAPLAIMLNGGVIELLERQGLIAKAS